MAKTHGDTGTHLYKAWDSMIQRCRLDSWYVDIKVCDEWLKSYVAFRQWALANGYAEHLQLDRKDSTKDYSPDNCRWVTQQQNVWNRRKWGGTSKYKGVCWHKGSGAWMAYIGVNRKVKHLGYFNIELEAAQAYDIAAKQYHGEYACLNFSATVS